VTEERSEADSRTVGSPAQLEPGTLVDLYLGAAARHARADALLRRRPDGSWEHLSHQGVATRVRDLALGLRVMGYDRGTRIGILSDTRLEWALADYAIVMAGLVSVPVYPVLPPDQIAYALRHAEARALFVSDSEQLAKVWAVLDELPDLERIIVFDPEQMPAEVCGRLEPSGLEALAESGRNADAALKDSYEPYARETQPEDLATLIYTSGTTGPPKGVMLTHDNLYSNTIFATRRFPVEPTDRSLSILPLAHVFERMAGHYLMWHAGVSIAYAESRDTIVRDMGEVQPTIMTVVPRVFDKILETAEARARTAGGLTWKIFRWARAVGEERAGRRLEGRPMGLWLQTRATVADRLVFRKLRDRTGGHLRFFVSGGAPLDPNVARFFFAAGMPILEGYGLTETSPVLCFNPIDRPRLGAVGPPIDGVEIRIAEDGEILARGRQNMKGYFRDEAATREVLLEDGWFRTGDIGRLDEEGYLRITDRKKELIITAYGKNIAPQRVEEALRRSPFVSQAVMLGDRQKYPIVLVVTEPSAVSEEAARLGLSGDLPDVVTDERLHAIIEEDVLGRCQEFAHFERPRRVLLVTDEFTVEGGELTPTLKVKRRHVAEKYAETIARLYREAR
jgi:long-chain acyl-CoA synthetase